MDRLQVSVGEKAAVKKMLLNIKVNKALRNLKSSRVSAVERWRLQTARSDFLLLINIIINLIVYIWLSPLLKHFPTFTLKAAVA